MKDFHSGTEGLICQKNCEGWMVGVWEGLNLGSIPNDHMPSQKDPKISIERRCSTILPLTLLILFLLKFFMMQTDGALKQDCGDLTLTLEKRCHFRYEIENYFSCSHLARRDCDYHMIILVFRDENKITYCYSHASRRDRDFRYHFSLSSEKR